MINLSMIAHDINEIKENINEIKDKPENREQLKLEEKGNKR